MSNKITKIIGYSIFAASILVVFLFFFIDFSELTQKIGEAETLDQQAKILEIANLGIGWSGFVLTWSIILLIACATLVVGFAAYKFIIDTIHDPKTAIKPLIVLASIIVLISLTLFLITKPYVISHEFIDYAGGKLSAYGEFMRKILLANGANENNWISWSVTVGTTLRVTYFFFGFTILALLYAEVTKALK